MSGDERWSRSEDVLWRQVLDDAVLLTPSDPEPFALAGGALLWDLLAQPRTVADLVDAICERTDADPAAVDIGIREVLADLEGRGAVHGERP